MGISLHFSEAVRRWAQGANVGLLPQGTYMGKLAQFHFFTSSFTQKMSLLNTEELATLWHLPTEAVITQPIMERIEAKKMGPPPNLPIFREGNKELQIWRRSHFLSF